MRFIKLVHLNGFLFVFNSFATLFKLLRNSIESIELRSAVYRSLLDLITQNTIQSSIHFQLTPILHPSCSDLTFVVCKSRWTFIIARTSTSKSSNHLPLTVDINATQSLITVSLSHQSVISYARAPAFLPEPRGKMSFRHNTKRSTQHLRLQWGPLKPCPFWLATFIHKFRREEPAQNVYRSRFSNQIYAPDWLPRLTAAIIMSYLRLRQTTAL